MQDNPQGQSSTPNPNNRKQKQKSRRRFKKATTQFILLTVFCGAFLATSSILASVDFFEWHTTGAIWALFLFFICSGAALRIQLIENSSKTTKPTFWGMLVTVFGFALCFSLQIGKSHREDVLSGIITPANDPLPSLPPAVNPEEAKQFMLLFIGDSVSLPMWFPHSVIKFGEKSILTISTNSQGITVSCELFGENGNIVAMLETNKFLINPLNYFRRERPDRHTLVIYDQQNIQVLNVRYLNPKAIKITGHIRILDGPTVDIEEDHFSIGNRAYSQNFFGACVNDIVIPKYKPN